MKKENQAFFGGKIKKKFLGKEVVSFWCSEGHFWMVGLTLTLVKIKRDDGEEIY